MIVNGFGANSRLITLGLGLKELIRKLFKILSFKSFIKTFLDA